MTDSSSQSDDTSCGSSRNGSRGGSSGSRHVSSHSGHLQTAAAARRRKGVLNAKERNLRRLESNERERMRMHSLNDAFQVSSVHPGGFDFFISLVGMFPL